MVLVLVWRENCEVLGGEKEKGKGDVFCVGK